MTTRSTTSRGRDCQPNTVGSAPGGRPASEDAAEPWDSSAVAGPQWVSPDCPSPASVHAGPGLRRRRPRSHGPAPHPHRPSPRPSQKPGISPSGGSSTPRDRRNPAARGSGRYLAPRGGGRQGTVGPSTTGPDSRCRDGSTESLADVEGGGETSKDAATEPVRRPREDKPLPSCAAPWKCVLSSSSLRVGFCSSVTKYFSFPSELEADLSAVVS